MKVIIAEKPSVAKEIARIVGSKIKREGYLLGDEYCVTWAFGHLVTPAMPDEYGYNGFHRDNLPIIPPTFTLTPRKVKSQRGYRVDTGVAAQIEVIRKLFTECERIIVATDAGREGELIFRYLYQYLECAKPFDRLWISSLTDRAIKDGMSRLESGTNYDNLYYAAKARSEADWLVGINATQAISVNMGSGTYSVGRVQTPTLAMVCSRYWENKRFEPQPIHQLHLTAQGRSSEDIIRFTSTEKWSDKGEAEELHNSVKRIESMDILTVESKERVEQPPLLYDLTTLQKEANVRYGYSAEQTLTIAQSLYEAKLLTYPRTGCAYISKDVFAQIPTLLRFLKSHNIYTSYIERMGRVKEFCVDDSKITDHHAIIITGLKIGERTQDELNIYMMVVERMLEAFSDICVKDITTVTAQCAEVEFTAKGCVVRQSGWRALKGEQSEEVHIPEWSEGDSLPIKSYSLTSGKTKPKPLHSESSLLAAMQSADKEVEDRELRGYIKDIGIGTPATRAAIIETLIKRGYLVRQRRLLLPTEVGLALNSVVKSMRIADVEMTADWERRLAQIESGELSAEEFRRSIVEYTKEITAELLTCQRLFATKGESRHRCPKCKRGKLQLFPKVVKCSNEECGKAYFRVVAGKTLSDSEMIELLTKGKTKVLKGFNSKQHKPFSAALALDSEQNIKFVFNKK